MKQEIYDALQYTFLICLGILIGVLLMIFLRSHSREDEIAKARVIALDGCQYFIMQHGLPNTGNFALALAHKGNCTNTIHQPK